ncbi:Ulp1 protease family [Forsythia ovata]|uniref:Ulp1 protease family n=1 Tax=Forsythia ovata TaxID=205694 RepID=A0ABD1WGF9_9LAMI
MGCNKSRSRLNGRVTEDEPAVNLLKDDSKIQSHPGTTVPHSPAERSVNVADKVYASNVDTPGKEQQNAVRKQQSNINSKPSVIKPCCYEKESIRRRLSDIYTKHEKVVEDHFILKLQYQNLVTEIENSITDAIQAVRQYPATALSSGPVSSKFNTSWGEVENVFIPIFMEKRAHWILGHFDIANWHLDVYNSAYKTIRDVAVMDAIQPLLNIIPHLLRQSKVLKFEAPDSPLSCRLCKETPQQTNGLV